MELACGSRSQKGASVLHSVLGVVQRLVFSKNLKNDFGDGSQLQTSTVYCHHTAALKALESGWATGTSNN